MTSKKVLEVLSTNAKCNTFLEQCKKGISQVFVPELDASQVEVVTPPFKRKERDYLATFLGEAYEVVDSVVPALGYKLSTRPVPKQSFVPQHSGAKEHYENIHKLLLDVSKKTRKATNVTGVHFTIPAGNNFAHHIALSRYISSCLRQGDYEAIGMTEERYDAYNTVVAALQKTNMVSTGSVPPQLQSAHDVLEKQLDKTGNPYFSYALQRLKGGSEEGYLTECRTLDGPGSSEDAAKSVGIAAKIIEQSFGGNNVSHYA